MASNTSLRVGFIGAGWTERVQIPTFRLAGLTPQAIAASQRVNAERVARNLDVPEVHDSWQDLVQSPNIDIVSISTPPHLHCEIAVAALQAGKHVICEKPTALNIAEAERMFAAAQAATDQMAIIDHELRFHPLRLQLRKLMREGYAGSIVHIELDWRFSHRLSASTPWSWHNSAEHGGGYLGAIGSHLFDMARWLVGRVDALSADLTTVHFTRLDPSTGSQRAVTSDDHAHLLLRFATGARGTITASALHPENLGMSITVIGTEGALKIDYSDRLWGKRGDSFPNNEWEELQPEEPMLDKSLLPSSSPFAIGSYYLAKAIATSLPDGDLTLGDAANFYDGLVVQRALDAARLSSAKQDWVRI
jgi:predicted dehydrogenase